MYIKSTINPENTAPISFFIYMISEIVLLCIVLLLNPSPKLKFHIHDIPKRPFMYIPLRRPFKLTVATHLPVDPAHQHRNDVALLVLTERPMRRDVMPL